MGHSVYAIPNQGMHIGVSSMMPSIEKIDKIAGKGNTLKFDQI